MVRIGLSKHMRMAARHATGVGRQTSARLVSAALARLRRVNAPARHLVIVPPELRAADPSFWPEVQAGQFGLSGQVAELARGRPTPASPFAIEPPSEAWAAELHGFSWLRHLEAAANTEAEDAARSLIEVWINEGRRSKVASRPAVRARRILTWISHAPFVLDRASDQFFDAFGSALADDVKALAASRPREQEGLARLLTATALVVARLSIEGADEALPRALDRLDAEIDRQILLDGGHISRNPEVICQLLLDWMPLKSCLEARGREPRTPFIGAIHHMLAMLRFLRLGDGGIARFNGMGVGDPVAVATLLAYDDEPAARVVISKPSHYARLWCGGTIVIADVGPPPPLQASTAAHAGCLSIEVSTGGMLLLCNGGAPGTSACRWLSVARSTASHSTLSLSETSSALLVRNPRLEAAHGAQPLRGPDRVDARVSITDDGANLIASHDGYVGRYNLEHHRELRIEADGSTLLGRDRLQTPGAQDRLKHDLPFAIQFHLHPDSACRHAAGDEPGAPDALIVTLRDGQKWLFEAPGFRTGLEEGLYFACTSGPRPALQIVVRGLTGGLTDVAWSLKQLDPGPPRTVHNEGRQ